MVECCTKTRLFVIRHAESEANVSDLIVSDPEVGIKSYGLTPHGRQQVIQVSCQKLMSIFGESAREILSDKIIVISSDFKRAKETAKIIHQHFQVKTPLRFEQSLRERNFGELNLMESSNYQKVWVHDAQDPNHTVFGCESVASVFSRTAALIESLEAEYRDKGKVIVLISHGDTLQITLTAYAGVAPECHRTLDHLANGDVKELV